MSKRVSPFLREFYNYCGGLRDDANWHFDKGNGIGLDKVKFCYLR